MTTFEAYLLVMLSDVKIMLSIMTILTGALAFVLAVVSTDFGEYAKARNISCIFFVIIWISFTFTPTTKQAATIILLPAIINNEKIQTTVDNGLDLMELATEWMKDQIGKEVKEK